MNAIVKQPDQTVLINELGIVTAEQIIIYKGKQSNVISFENIKKVRLTKKRIFYTNLFFFLIAILSLFILFSTANLPLLAKYGIVLVSTSAILAGIFHKFYSYSIIINLKDNTFFIIKTSQFHKGRTKKFHVSIIKALKKRKSSVS